MFDSVRTVFEEAVSAPDAEVLLLALPRYRQGALDYGDTSSLDFCMALGKDITASAFDREREFDLEAWAPDYVFLNVPYTSEYPKRYAIRNLARYSRVCYIPYGYMMMEGEILHTCFGSRLFRLASFIFADGDLSWDFCRKRLFLSDMLFKKRLYRLGYPRFDLQFARRDSLPVRRSVLYLPRWKAAGKEDADNIGSSFLEYKDFFVSFALSHPDVEVVIRPHPLMFDNFTRNGLMTPEEVDAFRHAVSAIANLRLDEEPSYGNALAAADILAADFTSLLAEYFITARPICYLSGSRLFSRYDKMMFETFYHPGTPEDLGVILQNLLRGRDPKKEMRDSAVQDFYEQNACGRAGKEIFSLIRQDSGR